MRKAFYVVFLLLTVFLVMACTRQRSSQSEGADEASEIPASESSSAEGEQVHTSEESSEASMPTEAASEPASEPTAAADNGESTEPVAEVAPTSGSLTLEQLANGEYFSEWVEGGKVQLTDGFYREPLAEDAASELVITLSEVKAFGDLNADSLKDAAIILVTNAGGSGTFYELAGMINQNGTPHHSGSQFLGDRIELQSVAIEEGNIVVQMKTHSTDDPFCCPTVQTTERYQVQGEQLALLLPDEQPAEPIESVEGETVSTSLTLKTLANAEYRSEWADSGSIKLTDGVYEEAYEEGSAEALLVRLANITAFGDVNGDGTEDAVVVLVSEPGGTGSFYELAVVLNENGQPNNVATEFLGDRIELKGISIAKGEITVKALTNDSNGSSEEITQSYQLQGESLAKFPTEGEPLAEASSEEEPLAEVSSEGSFEDSSEGVASGVASGESLSLEVLENAEYLSGWLDEGKVKLTNGVYRQPYGEDSASELIISLAGFKAFGDLNDDGLEDAVVVLVTNPGGTGRFYDLAPVLNQNGTPLNTVKQELGERIQLKNLSIVEGKVVLDMLTHGAGDAKCCPTVEVIETYQVQRQQLALVSRENPIVPANQESLTTSTISYVPSVPSEAREGSCWTNSLSIPQAYAWRCKVNDQIFDPCLLSNDNTTLVCGVNPLTGEEGFQLNLTAPLPEPDAPLNAERANLPWIIALADGSSCTIATGATVVVDGKRINYLCSDDSSILGELLEEQGTWRAAKVILESADEGFMVKKSTLVPVSTIWQAADPMMMTDKLRLQPEEVYLNVSGLATSLQGSIQPAMPYDPTLPPNPNGHPEHLRIAFDNETLPESLSGQQRQLLIYPAAAYRAIYQAQGNHEIARTIDTLKGLVSDNPPALEGELPFLPPLGASQAFRVQIKPLSFQNGTGLRYITHYTEEASPMTNESIFYTFQGLTNDGQYYISLIYPVSTASLPNSYEESPWSNDYDAFIAVYDNYLQESTQALNSLPPADFTPNLEQLDAMIQSLMVGSE